MKLKTILACSFAAMLLGVGVSHAQDDDLGDLGTRRPARKAAADQEENSDPSRKGPSLGLGGTYAIETFDTSGGLNLDNSGGFNARIGYRFHPRIAGEVEIERFQQFDAHVGGTDVGEINAWSLGANVKGFVLTGKIQPYGLFGLGYADWETTNSANTANPEKTDDGLALRFGGGVDWYVTNKVVLTSDVTYLMGTGDASDYSTVALSFGIAYRP